MNNSNKLALSIIPLITFGLLGGFTFAYTCVAQWFKPELHIVCWEAGILAAVCYGFIMININQLNIHSETFEK